MYLKYFLESGIFAQDSKDSESRTLFYFVTDPSTQSVKAMIKLLIHLCSVKAIIIILLPWVEITEEGGR